MANTISTPSWREDQPWSIEQGLANSLGARSPNLAETMLTRYGIERQQNQADYHDYMRAINALQGQALSDSHSEARTKLAMELGEKAAQHGGLGQYYATNANTSDLAGGDMSLLNENAMNLSGAKQLHDIGLGMGGMGASGADQQSMAGVANNSPYTRGMTFLKPAVVQAQEEANKGRFAQAAASAGTKFLPRYSSEVSPATANQGATHVSILGRPDETPAQAQARVDSFRSHQTPGGNQFRSAFPPPAQTDGGPMEVTPHGSTPAGPRGTGPTADQATTTVTKKLSEWLANGSPDHRRIVNEASQYSHDQGQGGKFIVRMDGGRLYVLGRGGQAYLVQ